ncbi:MAG: hypothetical protein ACQEP9_02570 [Bacillota bacterium]
MNNYKDFKLIRYSDEELVFSSKKDFKQALQEFKSENDIIASFESDGKLKTILISSEIITKYRNDEINIYAEEKIT